MGWIENWLTNRKQKVEVCIFLLGKMQVVMCHMDMCWASTFYSLCSLDEDTESYGC